MRLRLGSLAPDFVAESIGGRRVSLTQLRGRPVLLKFYRFATCPICNLHMHRFIQEHRMVSNAGLTTVVLYHSPADKLAEAQDYATPFDLVPDGEKKIFRAYGVGRGLRGFVSPTVMREYLRALRTGYSPGLATSDGGVTGNPADFLIDASGRVVFAHYGKHYADSLEACDVVNAWRAVQREARTPNAASVIPSEARDRARPERGLSARMIAILRPTAQDDKTA
jgi:peroxiredoxin